MTYKTLLRLIVVLLLATCPKSSAETISLIDNGDFESGAVGWLVDSTAAPEDASWQLSLVGNPTPISGQATSTNGGGENTYAVADQVVVSTMALYQPFTVPEDATSVKFGFDMFVNDFALQLGVNPDQVVRVDILQAADSPLQAAGVFNAFLGNAGGPLPSPFASHEFEILPLLEPNQEYIARFYANVGVAILNVGVDNVYVNAEIVPEPNFGVLAFPVFAVAAFGIRRSRKRGK